MKTYVISLPQAAARRAQAAEQLNTVHIDFEFFDAISGADALGAYGFDCNQREFVLQTGRQPTSGEMGCFASHFLLWERCAASNAPILVLEDDFRLLPEFLQAFATAKDLIADLGFLRLQSEQESRFCAVFNRGGFEVLRYNKAPQGTMAYLIAPTVARALLQCGRSINAPVDVYVKQFWLHGQPLYGLRPYTATESALSYASSITGREKATKCLSLRLRRLSRKLQGFCSRHRFNRQLRRRLANRYPAATSPQTDIPSFALTRDK